MNDKSLTSVTCCVALFATAFSLNAQQSTSYDPAAAAGMTSGLPGSLDARDLEMQRVRAASNMARKDAQAAALIRSSDQAMEQQVYNRAVAEQQALKQDKARAAAIMQQEKAANAYNRVSLNQIQTWDDNGTVKIERGVPPVVMQQIAENDVAEAEAALAEAEAEAEAEKGGFRKAMQAPGNVARGAGSAVKGAMGFLPFVGSNDEEPIATQQPAEDPYAGADYGDEKKGIFKRVGGIFKKEDEIEPAMTNEAPATSTAAQLTERMNDEGEKTGLMKNIASSIPFIGSKRDSAADYEEPQMVQSEAPVKIPTVSATGEGLSELANDPPQPAPVSAPESTVASSGPFGPQSGVVSVETPEVEEEKTGMFSKLREKIGGNDDGGGFASNRSRDGSAVDASLFPETGDIPPLPAGSNGRVRSNEMLTGDGTASAAGLPSAEEEKKGFLAGITGGLSNAINNDEEDAPQVEPRAPKVALEKNPRSTQHGGGNSVYVVGAGAKFFRFGDTQFSSDVNELPAGTLVKMTKAGDEWSMIQLTNGATGNIKNKDLSPANAGQVAGASFGPASTSSASAF